MSDSSALIERAKAHARTVSLDLDFDALEWTVSSRARRRAGSCSWNPQREVATVTLARRAYDELDWETFAGIIRHELVHAWEFQRFGESDHGERFRERAAAVDAPRHCPAFAEPRYVLRCDSCGWQADRHRASRPVRRPDRYGCGSCGEDYVVTHLESGRTWTTGSGFRSARRALGDDW